MKKTLGTLLVLLLLAPGLLVGLGGCGVAGSGRTATQQCDFKDFTSVSIGSTFRFEIGQSSSYSISITASENLLSYVTKEDNTLNIGLRTGSYTNTTLRARVTMPLLRNLDFIGSAQGTVSGFGWAQSLESGYQARAHFP